ncbi:hypothetical protein WJX81_002014 [Elliptochloris bilobata]|uniref:Protein kinase domain-containing protein n=1 Tax=Elliptochloris bilobata TaxID=381761 RepID=A0AAW1RT64_9CHLO
MPAVSSPQYDLGRYQQTGVLGAGTFGVVVRAVDPDSLADCPAEVAIKLLPRGELLKNFKTYVTREILHQSCLEHPFIVSIKEVFLTRTHLAIAMEYAQGGDLFRYVLRHKAARLAESQARWIFQQLVIGLDFCHRSGVANRDLKLENMLLDRDGQDGTRPLLKICDFGYSKHEMNSSAKTGVGTPIYMAPEIIYGGNRYDAKAADLWSVGVILFAMLIGRYPFSQRESNVARNIVSATYSLPDDVQVSAPCRDLLARLLVANPSERMSMEEIKVHSWFLEDLPEGALAMNDWYLQSRPVYDQYQGMVEAMVEAAQLPGVPGEPLLSVELECAAH